MGLSTRICQLLGELSLYLRTNTVTGWCEFCSVSFPPNWKALEFASAAYLENMNDAALGAEWMRFSFHRRAS